MHIVVCIKQVPDSAQIRVHPVTNTIMRQGVPAIVNPYDLFALEELHVAARIVGRSATEAQVASAHAVLTEARRALYLILADCPAAPEAGTAGTDQQS